MRRSTIAELGGGTATPRQEDPSPFGLAAEAYGPKTAAWLLGQRAHRRKLHKAGAVDFAAPSRPSAEQAEHLRWFFLAMEYLRRRPNGAWAVDVRTQGPRRVYRVRWLCWLGNLPVGRTRRIVAEPS